MAVMSANGFPPTVWGPSLWRVMHILAFNYPLVPTKIQSDAHFRWFESLCTILPCRHCREEFCALVADPAGPYFLSPKLFAQPRAAPPGTARRRLIAYTTSLHAAVNVRLKKKYPKDLRHWIRYYAALRTRRTNAKPAPPPVKPAPPPVKVATAKTWREKPKMRRLLRRGLL